MDKLLLTAEEAAAVLGIDRSKMYELLAARAVESVRIGAARRVPAVAVRAYVESLRQAEREDAA